MNKEIFRILKEFQSLHLKKDELSKSIQNELQRIEKIEDQRTKRDKILQNDLVHLKQLKPEMTKIENQINETSNKLKNSRTKINQIASQHELEAINTQIDSYENELSQLEEKGLEILEQTEILEESITNAENFLKGTLETIKEIEGEIKEENEPLYHELNTLKNRIEILKPQIPEKVLNRIVELQSKGPKYSPIAEITPQNTCKACGYLPPKALVDSVEVKLKLHSCPGCNRIFIPESSKYL